MNDEAANLTTDQKTQYASKLSNEWLNRIEYRINITLSDTDNRVQIVY